MFRVLVVDDEPPVRRVIGHALGRPGWEIDESEDGLQALDALQGRRYDLVITDWNMPQMRGDALLAVCKQRYPDTDVLIVTGYPDVERAVAAIKAGATDYITKPLDMHSIREKVELLAAERELRQTGGSRDVVSALTAVGAALERSADTVSALAEALRVAAEALRASGATLYVRQGIVREGELTLQHGSAHPGLGWAMRLEWLAELARREPIWAFVGADGEVRDGADGGSGVVVPLVLEGREGGSIAIWRDPSEPPMGLDEGRALRLVALEVAGALAAARPASGDALVGAISRDALGAARLVAETLLRAIETYDDYTYRHSLRVADIAVRLGTLAGLPPEDVERLRIASWLHDIGKLGVGSVTLHKPGSLDASETDLVRLHPAQGARILSGLDILSDVVPLVLYHHERLDGSGYPDGLQGAAIPLGARIIAVADVYDSLISDRPYRPALTPDEVSAHLREAARGQLDGALVRLWLSYLEARECPGAADAPVQAEDSDAGG